MQDPAARPVLPYGTTATRSQPRLPWWVAALNIPGVAVLLLPFDGYLSSPEDYVDNTLLGLALRGSLDLREVVRSGDWGELLFCTVWYTLLLLPLGAGVWHWRLARSARPRRTAERAIAIGFACTSTIVIAFTSVVMPWWRRRDGVGLVLSAVPIVSLLATWVVALLLRHRRRSPDAAVAAVLPGCHGAALIWLLCATFAESEISAVSGGAAPAFILCVIQMIGVVEWTRSDTHPARQSA